MKNEIKRAKALLKSKGYIVEKLETENDSCYKVSYDSNGVSSTVLVKAKDEATAMEIFKNKKPDYEVISASYVHPDDVENLKKRGMSLLEADIRIPKDKMFNPDKIDLGKIAQDAADKEKEELEEKEREERKKEIEEKYKDVLSIEDKEIPSDTLQEFFDELVPRSGKADTLAGEVVRAMMRILYRDYNDGDLFYDGYGVETCGASVSFIVYNVPEVKPMFERIVLKSLKGDEYTKSLERITQSIINIMRDLPEEFLIENIDDSREAPLLREFDEWIRYYDYDVQIPDAILDHINRGDISARGFLYDVESWEIFEGEGSFNITNYGGTLEISDLPREIYDEVESYLEEELESYAEELDQEFGEVNENEDEEEEE